MKLFVGLWNPWAQYMHTRHNAWFLLLEALCAQEWFTDFLYQKKFDAEMCTGTLGKRQILAAKPQTFMNRSGNSVREIMQFYKINAEDVLLFHDEIDIAFGAIKLKFNGSAAWHNGIKDIYGKTGSTWFRRLKLGVGRPDHPWFSVSDYVLGNFTATELKWRRDHEKDVFQRVEEYLKNTGGTGK